MRLVMKFSSTTALAKKLIEGKVYYCEHNGDVSFCEESGDFTVSLSDVVYKELVDITPKRLNEVLQNNSVLCWVKHKDKTKIALIVEYDHDTHMNGQPPYFADDGSAHYEPKPVIPADIGFIDSDFVVY